ncbi:hypothetical protein ACFVJM_27980 [Streptomyces virginiae]|uniref:hypothetical protein n=1 Tax=Streptomyces virginiae TaxID=1961 RepID=UPI003629E4B4
MTVVVGMGAARIHGPQDCHLRRHGSRRVLLTGLVVEDHDEDLVVLVGEVDADALPAGRHGRVDQAVDGLGEVVLVQQRVVPLPASAACAAAFFDAHRSARNASTRAIGLPFDVLRRTRKSRSGGG